VVLLFLPPLPLLRQLLFLFRLLLLPLPLPRSLLLFLLGERGGAKGGGSRAGVVLLE
jgi:hypothetical protein